MPWCTLGDPLPYITGSYYMATTFVIENNVIPLEYVINIVRQKTMSQRTQIVLYMVSARDVFIEDM
jgi:hypothetical protein